MFIEKLIDLYGLDPVHFNPFYEETPAVQPQSQEVQQEDPESQAVSGAEYLDKLLSRAKDNESRGAGRDEPTDPLTDV